MGLILPNSIKSQIERPQGTNEALWFFEVELDRGSTVRPPVILRICDGQERIEWPLGILPAVFWEPFPFDFTPIEQTNEGDLSQVSLTIDNSARTLMRFLHDGHGLEGNRADLFVAYRNGLSIAYPNHEYQKIAMEVQLAAANDEAVTFTLGMPNWFAITSPTARYVPKRCKRDFGAPDCGYVINSLAAYSRCPKTVGACALRGADMVARGLPAILPGNYGGHPGISNQR